MKRLLSFIVCFLMVCALIPVLSNNANAMSVEEAEAPSGFVKVSESVQQISDDFFLIVTTYEEPVLTRATRYTKSGIRTHRAVNADGNSLYTFTIEATYKITSGISSTCTSVTHSYQIYHSDWNYVSGSSYKSGNCAYGNAEFNRKLLGIVVETRSCDISLACDVNGNFS